MCGAGTDDVRVVFYRGGRLERGARRKLVYGPYGSHASSHRIKRNKSSRNGNAGSTTARLPESKHDTLTYTRQTNHADAAVPELPVPRRFRDASRTPRSSTTNVAEPTALQELFASVADRFPDASRCNMSLSSQAWDHASPKAGPGLSELKLEAN